MLTHSRATRPSFSLVTLVGLVALPLAVAFADDQEPAANAVPKDQAAILRGRVTDESGAPLAGVRVRVAIPAADMRFVDPSTPHKRLEAKSDPDGNYRIEIPGIEGRATISIDAMKPGYRRLVGTLMSGGDSKRVEVTPGMVAEASLILKPALYFAGLVVDEQGNPIPSVSVSANFNLPRLSGGVERSASNSVGSFELFNYPLQPMIDGNAVGKGGLRFSHPDYLDSKIDDVYTLGEDERGELLVVLGTGRKVAGRLLDVAGKPAPGTMVKATGEDGQHRKATTTDAEGKFALRGLNKGPIRLSARDLNIKQKIQMTLDGDNDKNDLELRLQPISLPADLKARAVLGMQLADVTPELKAAYDLYHERGALILDPGKDSNRLGIGQIAEGNCFFMVGNKRIGSVHEFVSQILAETAGRDADLHSVRVVYTFSALKADGTYTQHMKLTRDDLKQLQTLADQLAATP